jgi:hypothetical protein
MPTIIDARAVDVLELESEKISLPQRFFRKHNPSVCIEFPVLQSAQFAEAL